MASSTTEDERTGQTKRSGSIRGLRPSFSTQSFRTALKMGFKGKSEGPVDEEDYGNSEFRVEEDVANNGIEEEDDEEAHESDLSRPSYNNNQHGRSKSNSVSGTSSGNRRSLSASHNYSRQGRSASVSGAQAKLIQKRQQIQNNDESRTTISSNNNNLSSAPTWAVVKNQVIGGMKEPFSLKDGSPVQWISSLNISWSS